MAFFKAVLEIQKKNIQHKINEVNKILTKEDKNIVFIGTIGVGKTTAICSLFDLFDTSGKRILPILKTGAGATTICEVEIEFGLTNQLRIDPYSTQELEQLISEYVDTLTGNNVNVDGQRQAMTTELERAIKFMVAPNGMSLIDIDPYITDIINQNNNDKAKIKQVLIERANLQERNQVVFTNNTQNTDALWLRTLFSDINDGKIANASLPKKMYITINLGNKVPNKIIDTKGMDSRNPEFLREDLDRYIKNPDNLIVYCSSFPAAPDSDIMDSLKYYNQKFPDIDKRMMLLIIPKNNEPEQVAGVDFSSETDTYEQGIQIRVSTVYNQINGQFRNGLKIFFHNSILTPERKHYNNNITDILEFQSNLIEKSKSEKSKLEFNLKNIIEHQLTDEQKKLEQQINVNIQNLMADLGNIQLNPNGFIAEYQQNYGNRYRAANTKNAIHVRLGKFNTKNVYFDFEVDIEKLFTDLFSRANILSRMQFHLGITQEIIQEIIPSIYEDIENRILAMNTIQIAEMRDYFENQALNYAFWQPMIQRWGGGPGYNVAVSKSLGHQMQAINIENEILQQFNEKWSILLDDFINDLN
jgi:hypothetical protein